MSLSKEDAVEILKAENEVINGVLNGDSRRDIEYELRTYVCDNIERIKLVESGDTKPYVALIKLKPDLRSIATIAAEKTYQAALEQELANCVAACNNIKNDDLNEIDLVKMKLNHHVDTCSSEASKWFNMLIRLKK